MTHRPVTPKTLSQRQAPGSAVKSLIAVLLGWACVSSAANVSAATQPHGDILNMVEFAALQAATDQGLERVEVRVRPLDQRLRPALCDRELEIVRPHNGRVLGPVSYGVRCSGSVPWTLYLRAEVSASLDLPVLKKALPRGSILGADDLEIVTRRVTAQVADVILEPAAAEGMELKRPLPAGSTLRHGHVDLPELVSRGQMVTLIAGGGGVEVRMQGKAMGSGAQGDRLLVTNLTSGRRVEGLILPDGSIRIP
ncbi:flagellar basal body P-ring formation chaperone FlgA [Congregibacter litoralis]|uniref:Flagella basal body P-ring formation protein FlgA n=1 Tax=Congregibacter litoralis KT71 TaxID=314285 RepID=A4A619_9GAMM|nr:flagellar basal body P-ring formation chaperone FlgA [Congregibacter litoralis]EAQ98466.1 flagella basal body P-ring formation protein FlgA [Congregibacter litoralis KT71]